VFVDPGSVKEKRARLVSTRPEPTIYGNCDSWDFIVGKLTHTHSPKTRLTGRCSFATRILSTSYPQSICHSDEQVVDQLWINGGLLKGISHRERTLRFLPSMKAQDA
jgi:hypothetical protein